MNNLPWDNKDYIPNKLLQAEFIPAKSTVYPDRPQSPHLKDSNTSSAGSGSAPAAQKPTGRYMPPSQRNKAGRGGTSLADRIRAEREGGSVSAGKVKGKPTKVTGATGKVVVGMAPVEQKSKSALRREKAKKKKEEEAARQALEEKVLAEAKAAEAPPPAQAADPEKRAKKINKTLRQIDDLKQKDPSALNDDQEKKIESEASLREELAKLGI